MAILSYPDTLSLSGNIKDFVISASSAVRFSLYKGEQLLLDSLYNPDPCGLVTIKVKDIVNSHLSFALSSDDNYSQSGIYGDFRAVIDGTEVSFRAIRCGVSSLNVSAAVFLLGNFLSWQPEVVDTRYSQPQWLTYYNPGVSDVTIKVRFYKDAQIVQTLSLATINPSSCVTTNVQFARIWGLSSIDKDGYYDIFAVNTNNEVVTYTQRYILSQSTPEDKFFLFENTLGGLDSAVFTGESVYAPQTVFRKSTYDEVSVNTHQETHQNYRQNTGYKSAREILWLKDFWSASGRYVVKDGSILPITIEEGNLQASNLEKLQNFEFTYQLGEDSGFQNITRNTDLATPLEITTPDQLFFLVPRLAEFQEVELQDFLLFPIQSPYEETWYKLTLGSLKEFIKTSAQEVVEPSTHGHSNKTVLDQFIQTDINILRLLSLDINGNLCLKQKKLIVDTQITSPEFRTIDAILSTIFGKGTIIKDGLIQTDRLEVRQSMSVMEMIINQLQGIAADFIFTDVGKVIEVKDLGENTYLLKIDKKTETDFTTIGTNDIIHQIVNTIPTGGSEYYSSWMRVLTINIAANSITAVLYNDDAVPGGANFPPTAGFNIARKGNAGEETIRQQLWMISSREGRIQFLQNVLQPLLQDYNYALTLGKLPDITAIKQLPVSTDDIGLVAQTAIVERLFQFDYNGDVVAQKVDRGPWSAEVAASDQPYRNIQHLNEDPTGNTYTLLEQHTVWYLGCRWGCLTDKTLLAPKWNSPHWVMLEGNEELEMRFTSSEGDKFHAGKVDTMVTPSVYLGNMDISEDIADIDWAWVYEVGTFAGRILHLTNDLMPPTWSKMNKAKFTCTAYVRVGNDVVPVENNVII